MSRDGVIRIEELTKRYKDQIAVDRLTLDVPAGSVFGLLGENGAGKTTTLQMVLGLIVPDQGRIETLGLDPTRFGIEVRRRTGYVPEVPSLYDWMTVAEIGWFAAGFHPEPRAGTTPFRPRFEELVRGFELPLNRKIKQLSKGMRAKVSLALAVASEPELLVLDEPTSGLDIMVRREFLESMVDVASAGRTVLLSSHQIAEVERVASHVAVLHQGRLILCEPLDELLARTFVVTVNFAGNAYVAPPPDTPAFELVDAEETPRQARWVVHAPGDDLASVVRATSGVGDISIETPSLEEIYIAYRRRRRGPASRAASPSAHVA